MRYNPDISRLAIAMLTELFFKLYDILFSTFAIPAE
jgi:hypothetical protein